MDAQTVDATFHDSVVQAHRVDQRVDIVFDEQCALTFLGTHGFFSFHIVNWFIINTLTIIASCTDPVKG
jgi:hypothetical protein